MQIMIDPFLCIIAGHATYKYSAATLAHIAEIKFQVSRKKAIVDYDSG